MVNLPLVEGEGRSGAAGQARVYTSDFLDKVTKLIGMSLSSGTNCMALFLLWRMGKWSPSISALENQGI